MEARILDACMNNRVHEAVALLKQHNIDPNAPVFGTGPTTEPLLIVLAHTGHLIAFPVLREEAGADPEVVGSGGSTPLAIMLDFTLQIWGGNVDVEDVQHTVFLVGARLDTPGTQRSLATLFFNRCNMHDFDALIDAGILLTDRPLMHLFNSVSTNMDIAIQLLDTYNQDPFERDAKGFTLMDYYEKAVDTADMCTGDATDDDDVIVTPELNELLHDAFEEPEQRDLAVIMAFHSRLGAGSLIRVLDADLLKMFVLPHAIRRRDIGLTRATRVREWSEIEGVLIDPDRLSQYVEDGAMFLPAHFRRDHFLNSSTVKRYMEHIDCSELCIRARLEMHGIYFSEPWTQAYNKRAMNAIKHPLLK